MLADRLVFVLKYGVVLCLSKDAAMDMETVDIENANCLCQAEMDDDRGETHSATSEREV